MLKMIRKWATYFADNWYAYLIVFFAVGMIVVWHWHKKYGDSLYLFWGFLAVIVIILGLGTRAFWKKKDHL